MRTTKWFAIMLLAFVMTLGLTSGIFAFDDVKDDEAMDKIMFLKERGVLQGDGKSFHADKELTYAEGVQMIVKGMDLSLAAFLFIKEPLAGDSFDHVPNDAWYSQSFVIAAVNGLDLPRDLDPMTKMTREEFAYHLYTAMTLKGDFPFTKMLFHIADEADLNADYNHPLQLLLNGRIVSLDESGSFRPKEPITRRDAAVFLYNMIEYVERHSQPIPEEGITEEGVAEEGITEEGSAEEGVAGEAVVLEESVTHTSEKIDEQVDKVTLSRGEQPNSGYRITIAAIVFIDGQTAEIQYRLHDPEEEKSYLQVITTPTVSTYVSSEYDVVLKRVD